MSIVSLQLGLRGTPLVHPVEIPTSRFQGGLVKRFISEGLRILRIGTAGLRKHHRKSIFLAGVPRDAIRSTFLEAETSAK